MTWTHPSLSVNFRKSVSSCVVCAMSGSERRSFAGPLRPVTEPGAHWYMDVWGPAEHPSLLYQNAYMVGLKDAATKYLLLYFVRNKSMVLDCVKDLYERVIVKRRVSYKLTDFVVQSDNGEFKSESVLKFLLSVGGNRLTCCAYSPETQSAIERIWGILHNMSSAMLIGKKLSEPYWQFASDYACEIYNNIPPSHTPKGECHRTPHEKFYGIKHDCSMLKVFGCRAFAYIDKKRRRKNHNP